MTELRLIGSSAPRYNRRSKFPERTQWIKITDEPFPRLSMVRAVRDDGATYFGPFTRRKSAEDVTLAIYDGFPIRQCTPRLSSTHRSLPAPLPAWADARRRVTARSLGTVTSEIVEAVRAALSLDARPAVLSVQARLKRLISQQRFEEAAIIRRRLEDADPYGCPLPPHSQPRGLR